MKFKGRFFSPEDEKELAEIRRANLSLLHDQMETDDRFLLHDPSEPRGQLLLHDRLESDGPSDMLFPEAYDGASGRKRRRVWRHGLSFLHLVVMAGSLFLLFLLFISLKSNLVHQVQAYLLGA